MRFSHPSTIALLGFLAIGLAACETTSEPDDVPYRERIVVRGELQVGETLWDLQLSRTLPLTETYTREKAAITDAAVTVEENGVPHQLRHDSAGHYSAPELTIKSGAVYKLSVDWHGKRVTATTTAPYPVIIDSATIEHRPYLYNPDNDFYDVPEVFFRPVGDQVYGLAFDYITPDEFYNSGLGDYSWIMRRSDTNAGGFIALTSLDDFGVHHFASGDAITAHVISFDHPFYDYYYTDHPRESGGDIFFSAGDNTRWNVEGDAIGIFIARQVTDTTFQVP